MTSLAEIQDVPQGNLILLTGPPGAGKSVFCHQAVLTGLAMEKPVVFVTTEHKPAEIIGLLREKGMGELPPNTLNFIDAFGETVGVTMPQRPDTISANCEDLNSISMAIARMQELISRRDVFLAFDSLTAPYLFNEKEVFRFMRLCLVKFASEGNSVLALMDEGCGKEEDLTAMMSAADGIVRIETKGDKRLFNVVKHPKVRPTRIEVPELERIRLEELVFNPDVLAGYVRGNKAVFRQEVGDFVNSFWPNFAHWSGMLWDPKRFPMMVYEMNKEEAPAMFKLMKENEAIKHAMFPWPRSLLLRLMPKSFSKVKDVKKVFRVMVRLPGGLNQERFGIYEYLEDVSKTDEHYFRLYESSECWGFENVGATISSYILPVLAGLLKGMESWRGLERDWNAIETKCIGLGDPYCEAKFVPGQIDELKDSLEKDISVIERIHHRLMNHLMEFLLNGKPLLERPTLGSMVGMDRVSHAMVLPALAGERFRMVLGMAGARSGKQVGDRLLEAGLSEDEAIKRVVDFMNYCKVGKVTVGETIRIVENCESSDRILLMMKDKTPSCYFTTGFLNGLFSAVKNLHVREIKCIATGDPYCEWEII